METDAGTPVSVSDAAVQDAIFSSATANPRHDANAVRLSHTHSHTHAHTHTYTHTHTHTLSLSLSLSVFFFSFPLSLLVSSRLAFSLLDLFTAC